MRNGFAKFAKWVVNFAMRNFAQVGTNEQCIDIAKLALRNFRIANLNLALRNWFWHCEIGFAKFSHCEWNLALRNWLCELIVNFAMRNFA